MSTRRFKSSFLSRLGHRWEAQIDRRVGKSATPIVEILSDFYFDLEAGEISWAENEKWEPLQGSTCTLRLISPGDRDFVELYASEVGEVVLTLRRDGVLFWQGALDPEFYEEPYSTARGYTVELTFSDLGGLDMLAFTAPEGDAPFVSVFEIIREGLSAAGLNPFIEEQHTLRYPDGTRLELTDISVNPANFFDEEGEPSKWREVIEGVLQPLGLRIVQTHGAFIIYDLHQAYSRSTPELIQWDGEDQFLSCDVIYNNISVEFSPYGDSKVSECEVDEDKLDNLTFGQSYNRTVQNSTYEAFSIFVTRDYQDELPKLLSGAGCYYRTYRKYGGEDGAGIAGVITKGATGPQELFFGSPTWAWHKNKEGRYDNIRGVFKAVEKRLSPGGVGAAGAELLRIKLEVLLDSRYNPFEAAELDNEEGDYKRQSKLWNIVFIPVRIWYVCDNGDILVYSNDGVKNGYNYQPGTESVIGGSGWFPHSSFPDTASHDEPDWGSAWLCYYEWEQRNSRSPCSGWMTNKQCIGNYFGALPDWWDARDEGEFLEIPPVGGVLHVEVGSGFGFYSNDRYKLEQGFVYDDDEIYGDYNETPGDKKLENIGKYGPKSFKPVRWLLYKSLEIDIVDRYGREVDSDDIAHSATLRETAQNELEISTICGSSYGTLPTALGVYSLDGKPLGKLRRGELCDYPERLLIAAVASQYDHRHTVLSGTVSSTGFSMAATFMDAAQDNDEGPVPFLPVSADYYLQADEIEAKFIEISPQNYIPVE